MIVNEQQEIERGDLVKWYTYYIDGVIADGGTGIVLASDHSYESNEHAWHKVYKFKHFDTAWIVAIDIERLG